MITDLSGVPVFVVPAAGPPLAGEQQVTDLVGEAAWGGATWLAIPVERLPAAFFDLRTGIAGMLVQKAANYRLGLVLLGDAGAHLDASEPLRAFFAEGSRNANLLVEPDVDALARRIASR